MRRKSFILLFIILLNVFSNNLYAAYEEVNTAQGKVIRGISKSAALKRFGLPVSVSDNLWHYTGQEEFFVYFYDSVSIYLQPSFYSGQLGVPVEFKVFAESADYKIRDVTQSAEFIVNDPANFISFNPGFFVPKKPGRYQVLAKFKKDNYSRSYISNPSYVDIPQPKEAVPEEEKIISINILPYKPVLYAGTRMDFVAFATISNGGKNKYSVQEIGKQASWTVKSQDSSEKIKDSNSIYFNSPGKYQVFCLYKGTRSYPQNVVVQEPAGFLLKKTLKHITVLPEFVSVPKNTDVSYVALGSYYNNEVQDITSHSEWSVKDRNILKPQRSGLFFASSPGITEITATDDRVESSSVKAVVVNNAENSNIFKEEKENTAKDLADELRKDIDKLKNDFSKDSKGLRQIKLSPDSLSISIGEKGKQIIATGFYIDGQQEDLTILGDWKSSDDIIVTVAKGIVAPKYPGEAKIQMEFHGIKSNPATVKVEGPKLVSIIVSPESSVINIGGFLNLKAEGCFTDSSRQDITSSVNWILDNNNTLKVDKGAITAFGRGITNISAEFSNIKSLPVRVEVVLTSIWFLLMMLKFLFFIIILLVFILSVFYFLVQVNKGKLIALSSKPADFIIALYENNRDIFSLSGFKKNLCIPPIAYAKAVEEKLLNKSGDLLMFTILYEEAKYSKHVLSKKESARALYNYNNSLRILLSNYKGLALIKKKAIFLLSLKPFFIEESVCGLDDVKN